MRKRRGSKTISFSPNSHGVNGLGHVHKPNPYAAASYNARCNAPVSRFAVIAEPMVGVAPEPFRQGIVPAPRGGSLGRFVNWDGTHTD